MSKYLIFSGGVLCGVLLVVITVFVYLQFVMRGTAAPVPKSSEDTPPAADVASGGSEGRTTSTSTGFAPSVKPGSSAGDTGPLLTESIPLSSLPLTDTQKQLVSGLGIDYDTFMITPEMATCAEGRLGRAKVRELIAGTAPTFSEVTVLARCL